MNGNFCTANSLTRALLTTAAGLLLAVAANAQVPVDEHGNPIGSIDDLGAAERTSGSLEFGDESESVLAPLSAAELEELVGPIALYPDDLLAIVLPASTYPLQIVQAARFLDAYEQDSTLEPDEEWDESITALLNYPDVVRMLDEDIDWTWKLGEAVISQQADVISAVESFRDRAYAAGNLKSDERQMVSEEDGVIEITPVDDEIIYVPYYEPEQVIVYQPTPVYHYYARPCPVYYYPYPVGYSFVNGYFWGVTTAYDIGWSIDRLRVRHYSYWGHPYYGHSYYYGYYYRRPSINLYYSYYGGTRYAPNRFRDGDYWRPRTYGGSRPGYYRSFTQTTRSVTRSVSGTRDRDSIRVATSTTSRGDIRPTRVTTSTTSRGNTRPTRVREDSVVRDERVRSRRSEAGRDGSNEIRFRSRDEDRTLRTTVARESSAPTVRRSDRTRPVRITVPSTARETHVRATGNRGGGDLGRTRVAGSERTTRTAPTAPAARSSRPAAQTRDSEVANSRAERASARRSHGQRRMQRR